MIIVGIGTAANLYIAFKKAKELAKDRTIVWQFYLIQEKDT